MNFTYDQKNHDLDLFSFNTNLLSLNQEKLKLKSVGSQNYFCSRFTLSSTMSPEYIYMQVTRFRECLVLIHAFSFILSTKDR